MLNALIVLHKQNNFGFILILLSKNYEHTKKTILSSDVPELTHFPSQNFRHYH